jgi:hypothetical protein
MIMRAELSRWEVRLFGVCVVVMAYSDEQKAVALAALQANGGDFKKTAKFCRLPERSIRRWAAGENVPDGIDKNVTHKKEALADKLERLACKLADAAFEKSEDANLQSCATSMAIAIDKMQLLREKPTAINAQYDSPEARMERLSAIFDRAGSRRSGTAPELGTEQPTVH